MSDKEGMSVCLSVCLSAYFIPQSAQFCEYLRKEATMKPKSVPFPSKLSLLFCPEDERSKLL
jgi:hypothetical protein